MHPGTCSLVHPNFCQSLAYHEMASTWWKWALVICVVIHGILECEHLRDLFLLMLSLGWMAIWMVLMMWLSRTKAHEVPKVPDLVVPACCLVCPACCHCEKKTCACKLSPQSHSIQRCTRFCVSLTVGFPTVAAEVCFSIVFATVSLPAVL